MMRRFYIVVNLLILSVFILGFRIMPGIGIWDIHRDDPTLWVKFCNEPEIQENDLPETDVLYQADLTFDSVVNSILEDFNSVGGSYLRLARYPDDPQNPGAPLPGDSTFTLTKAAQRTIEICFEDLGNFKGGEARPQMENRVTIACDIFLNNNIAESAKEFVATVSHEIGHCLGLGHDMESARSLMSYHSDATRLELDDKMGIIFRFPLETDYNQEIPTFGLSCATR